MSFTVEPDTGRRAARAVRRAVVPLVIVGAMAAGIGVAVHEYATDDDPAVAADSTSTTTALVAPSVAVTAAPSIAAPTVAPVANSGAASRTPTSSAARPPAVAPAVAPRTPVATSRPPATRPLIHLPTRSGTGPGAAGPWTVQGPYTIDLTAACPVSARIETTKSLTDGWVALAQLPPGRSSHVAPTAPKSLSFRVAVDAQCAWSVAVTVG
jgi:hypothetical protein